MTASSLCPSYCFMCGRCFANTLDCGIVDIQSTWVGWQDEGSIVFGWGQVGQRDLSF